MRETAGHETAVVIMAGGRGERFWPKSRGHRPKQFLQLFGEGTLLQQAYRRALRLAPPERVYVVTRADYRRLVAEQLPGLAPERLIEEPEGRDTAPCVGLAAVVLERRHPGGVMVVLPSDHAILDEEKFAAVLSTAARVAADRPVLVTVGIQPTRPETGYGYIQCGEVLDPETGLRAVRRFTEKPDADTALRFLMSGEHLWNSGMFAWRIPVIRDAIARHLPELHAGLEAIAAAVGTPAEREVLAAEFPRLPRVSIDYGVMEKAENVVVLRGDFGWDDLGTWAAMPRVGQADDQGNVVGGRAVLIDSRDCVVDGGRRLVVGFGIERLVIVDTDDVVFVSAADRAEELKRVVAELRRRGLDAYLTGDAGIAPEVLADGQGAGPAAGLVPEGVDLTTVAIRSTGPVRAVEKPWGREVWWAVTDRYVGKVLQVRAGEALSLQYHESKLETLLFVGGRGRLVLGDRTVEVAPGMAVTIPPGTLHRVEAETDLVFFEVSSPETEDVVRVADRYGRA